MTWFLSFLGYMSWPAYYEFLCMDELAMVLYKRRTRVLLFGVSFPIVPSFSRGAFIPFNLLHSIVLIFTFNLSFKL